MVTSSPPGSSFEPKDGRTLKVVRVARISTDKQDLQSLDDQKAKVEAYIKSRYTGKIEFIDIASQGCGEHLDTEELYELERQIESRTVDIVGSEDLSRICRRRRAYDFCEMCVDCDTRLIAINDRVDTAEEGWEDNAFFATWHHERSNRDTANRIKRSLNHRFDEGGVVQFEIFGYIKPPGIKNDRDMQKVIDAEPIIEEMFRRLENGTHYTEVADWLNENGIKPGPYCRRGNWSGPLVNSFVHQPILKGMRVRNRKVSKRVNKTGRHKSVKGDPKNLRYRMCPHLAFVKPAYYDHVIKLLDDRNRTRGGSANGHHNPRKDVPRKRTAFPGQHARCAICGRLMYWHKSQGRSYLLCKGAYEYKCWNALYVFGPDCAEKIPAAVLAAISEMPDFDAVFGDLVRQQTTGFQEHRTERRQKLNRQLEDVRSRLAHICNAIELGKSLDMLLARSSELEKEQSSLEFQLQQLDAEPHPEVALPQAQELRERFVLALQNLCKDDQETVRLLRQLLPDLQIVPYEICGGSDIVARAEFTLTLTPLLPAEFRSRAESETFTRRMVVTLGSVSQPVAFHAEAAALQQQDVKQRDIAARLGLAQSAVEKALRIHRQMVQEGLTEPFIRLTSLPIECHRLRRHKHLRYQFEPLPGYPN